ncbi:hypothetical protein IW262DRAFT_1299670 [Armillaria fumosa]|nr:hypothetical protein IW262DRAFT_1299670 [Armillaria fumosa]
MIEKIWRRRGHCSEVQKDWEAVRQSDLVAGWCSYPQAQAEQGMRTTQRFVRAATIHAVIRLINIDEKGKEDTHSPRAGPLTTLHGFGIRGRRDGWMCKHTLCSRMSHGTAAPYLEMARIPVRALTQCRQGTSNGCSPSQFWSEEDIPEVAVLVISVIHYDCNPQVSFPLKTPMWERREGTGQAPVQTQAPPPPPPTPPPSPPPPPSQVLMKKVKNVNT